MTVTIEKGGALAVPLADLKTYLGISLSDEDGLLTDLLRSATDAAERFLGRILVARAVDEVVAARCEWQALGLRPVRSIMAVAGIPADGPEYPLPVEDYAIDIDADGTGWLRVLKPGPAGRVRIGYQAGIASDEEGVPDAIQHGIVRLAGEYHARREGLEGELPASVAALWRPWRRARLA